MRDALQANEGYKSKKSNLYIFPDEDVYKEQIIQHVRVPLNIHIELERQGGGSMAENGTRRGFIMRYYLFFIALFFCPFLFAQSEMRGIPFTQNDTKASLQLEEVSALVTLFEERKLPLDHVPFFSEAFNTISFTNSDLLPALVTHLKAKNWFENYAPGPLFNTCITLALSVRCYWLVLRVDRLTNTNQELQDPVKSQKLQDQKLQVKEMINSQLSFENFKEEIHRLQAVPLQTRLEVATWFLFLALEFQDWATEQGVSDPERFISCC